ncbi:UV-damaged DNA-binding protein rad7 [Kalmusia sp. IMI 367209]|nr:UV-damaged DNA-binding protein rad7 [Kalmusia sp. IMI 367209]
MGRKQPHVYDPAQMKALEGVLLPDRIKCDRCQKYRNQASFSNKQLTDARYAIKFLRQTSGWKIKCQVCSGGPIVEIECSACGVTKGLEAFAKAQRKKLDLAECFKCTDKRLDLDPVNEEAYEHSDRSRAFVHPDAGSGYYPSVFEASDTSDTVTEWDDVKYSGGLLDKNDGGVGLSEGFARKISISDSSSAGTLIEAEFDRGSRASGDNGCNTVHARSWHTSSQKTHSASASSTGFNPNNYGNPAASRSISGSQRSFNSSIAERSDALSMKGHSFAKIKAYDPKKDPNALAVRPVRDEWSSDESASDDDDEDDDDKKMSGRRARGAGIRGPHSALTDFLAANNISAQEIRDSYRQRQQQAEAESTENGEADDNGEGPSNVNNEEDLQAESSAMAAERTRKRKRNQEEAIAKIKKGKAAKKSAKKKKKGSDDDSDFEDLMDMYKKAKPLPGQLENCELCGKRFTVTPYSKAGSDGGLLCTKCGKEMTKEAKATIKASKPTVRKGRRKIESNRLDGLTFRGAKTLQQLCIEKLAKHSDDIEEFGDMPQPIMNKLSEIFSKKRAMKSNTFKLFLQPDVDTVAIHEAAYLETEDYDQIFAVVPHIKKLSLRNCCQFKDSNVDYMIEKAKGLVDIQLLGANLVSNDKWMDLFIARGHDLKSLKLEWLDAAFDDQAVEALSTFCPNIERLKLERCKQLGPDSIDAIARLGQLQHLTLCYQKDIPRDRVVNLITNVGANLRTLCLEHFIDAENDNGPTDELLDVVHNTCTHLKKLRFSENNECSDAGYVNLFTEWTNPPLRYIDVNSTRDVDNSTPDGPEDDPIGLASAGFHALMQHSGSKLEYLDISSCRHISHETFAHIFSPEQTWPCLREINLSFCPVVDTAVIAGIFRSCPQIKKVVTFGCFEVTDVVVPRDIVLIGAPRAQDAIEQFGQVVMDFQKEMVGMETQMGGGRIVPVMS